MKNEENSKVCKNYELVPSLPVKKIFFSTNQTILKKRNWTFSVGHSATWKLEFLSNILWMIVALEK